MCRSRGKEEDARARRSERVVWLPFWQMSQQQQGGAAASAGTPGTSSTAAHQGQGKGSAGLQGVTQVSLLGQIPAELLDQVLRRLRGHCEHEERFELHEDVLTRGAR